MSTFTTEHPLVSQPSWFDAKDHPALSFASNSILLELILAPWAYGCVLYGALMDEVQSTDVPPLPGSWTELLFEVGFVFVFCLICATLLVSGYRLWQWLGTR